MQAAVEENGPHEKRPRRKRSLAYYLWLLTGIAASIATVAGVMLEHWNTIKTWPRLVERTLERLISKDDRDETPLSPKIPEIKPIEIKPIFKNSSEKPAPKVADFRCPATGDDSAMMSGRYLFRQEWPAGSPCDAESIIGTLDERCEFSIAIRQRGADLPCRGIVDPKSKSFLTRGTTPTAPGEKPDCISGEFTEAVIETSVCGKGQLKILKRL